MIVLLWRAGLRVSETVALALRDVDLESGKVRVRRGKGSKARTVALDVEACAVVSSWLAKRPNIPRAPLLCTLAGTQLQTSHVRRTLKRLATKAGIEKRVHPHGLRHTFSVDLAVEGAPLNVVQHALGHANVSTTSDYIRHVGAPEVVAAIRARPSWVTAPRAEPEPAAPSERARPSTHKPRNGKAPSASRPTKRRPPSKGRAAKRGAAKRRPVAKGRARKR